MTLQTPFDRGFTVYPFMFIPKRLSKDSPEYNAYVAHEEVHYIRQGLLAPIWIAKYLLDKKFRWQEERLAYTAEIGHLKSKGIKVDKKFYIKVLSTQYWGMVSGLTAKTFVDNL